MQPGSERLQPKLSKPRPQSQGFTRLSTEGLRPRDRFGYWRELFIASHLDRPHIETESTFRGELRGCAHACGAVFANVRADPVVCRIGGRDSDLIAIGHIRRGTLRALQNGCAAAFDPTSELMLLDCDRPVTTSCETDHDLSYLLLSRSMVVDALGRDPLPSRAALSRVPQSGLSRILLTHLQGLAEHGEKLSETEVDIVMKAATAMALALLSGLDDVPPESSTLVEDGLYEAALRHMERSAWKHDLTAGSIAAAVGCSRAHLYRLFTARNETVAGRLRNLRLTRARHLLEADSPQTIGMIAFNTGYTDLSAFGKAFKRLYGASPREWREFVLERARRTQPRRI